MCLLIVLWHAHPDSPLVVAANRDEWLARPAVAMTVLEAGILGGRDQVAGGTWLAVNAHGVIAALTNQPTVGGRDPRKRSRGELPLMLARHRSAEDAARAFALEVRPADYNPGWILVGDRDSLHYLDLSGQERPRAVALGPGLHVLENRPLEAASPKADQVRAAMQPAQAWRGEALMAGLADVLANHVIPACLHADAYGTRSANIISVPANVGLPDVRYSDGPPCTSPFVPARWPTA